MGIQYSTQNNTAFQSTRSHTQSHDDSIDQDCSLDQFVAQFPLLGAWVVHQDARPARQQAIAPAAIALSDNRVRTYLESEAWLPDYDPGPQLQEIALPVPGSCAYVFGFDQAGLDRTGLSYLLLWAYQSLSATQRSTLEFQARLLSNYVAVCQQRDQYRQTVQQLEQALRRVGHQLRHPLALIRLYAETLYLDLPDGTWRSQVGTIRDSVQQSCKNLTAILDYGRRRKLNTSICNIGSLLENSLGALQADLVQKRITVECSKTPATCIGDAAQLQQVLVNLLHNAICFSPEGGTITCRWTSFARDIVVEVRDQGPGLPPEDLTEVFTPFYSCRPDGTGLGLSIAQAIILDHHGRLWVDNLPTGGAQFSFVIPRQRPDAAV